MPSKKKTKKKLPIDRIIPLALLALSVIVITSFLTKHFHQEQQERQLLLEQKVRLDAAEKDIKSVSESFLAQFTPQEINTKEFNKDCGESSVKYGDGTITCGPGVFVRIYSSLPVDQLMRIETTLKASVESTDGRFVPAREPFLDAETMTEGRVFEVTYRYMDNEKTNCYFTSHIYTNEQYIKAHRGETPTSSSVVTLSAGCNETTKQPVYQLRR